jgi:predicted metal-dependent phosphotriesterase family hydrolase
MAHLNTVLGPIDESQVGHTMSHVHLTIDLMCWHLAPESGPMHGLSEAKITIDNLGTVRRNAMRVKTISSRMILGSPFGRLPNTASPVAPR